MTCQTAISEIKIFAIPQKKKGAKLRSKVNKSHFEQITSPTTI